jgi:hypothetical protein
MVVFEFGRALPGIVPDVTQLLGQFGIVPDDAVEVLRQPGALRRPESASHLA